MSACNQLDLELLILTDYAQKLPGHWPELVFMWTIESVNDYRFCEWFVQNS